MPKVFRKSADTRVMKRDLKTPQRGRFMCSELVTLKAGRQKLVGNLEEIDRNECSVLLDSYIRAGTEVRLECVDCPRKRRDQGCLNCRFAGKVEEQKQDAQLGRVTKISFHGRLWSSREWRPRHLTHSADPGGEASS